MLTSMDESQVLSLPPLLRRSHSLTSSLIFGMHPATNVRFLTGVGYEIQNSSVPHWNYHLEFYVPFTSRNPLSGNRSPWWHAVNPLRRFSVDLLANRPLGEIIWITPPAPPTAPKGNPLSPPTAERDALLATKTCQKRQRSLGISR